MLISCLFDVVGGPGVWQGEKGRGEGEREEERDRAQLPTPGEPGQSDASTAQSPHHAGNLPLPALQTGKYTTQHNYMVLFWFI